MKMGKRLERMVLSGAVMVIGRFKLDSKLHFK